MARKRLIGPSSRARRLALLPLLVLIAACGPAQSKPSDGSETSTPTATAVASLRPSPPQFDPVPAVPPAIKATIAGGIAPEIATYVQAAPGVAAAARVALGNAVVEISGRTSELSFAGIDAKEFQPLAPDVTAQAPFVWRSIAEGRMILAHEERSRLEINSSTSNIVFAKGPNTQTPIRIGGVAANGVPNLAGALISLPQARNIGLGEPTLLLIGVEKGQKLDKVKSELSKLLVGVKFEDVRPPGRAFLVGSAATKAIGSFKYTTNADGTISQDPAWVARHIVNASVPIFTGQVRCHRVMIPQLRAALAEIQAQGLAGLIDPKQYGGCYVPRHQLFDTKNPLSMHAWGLAIDFNVSTNQYGERPQLDPRIVAIFERWGFRWGGRWSIPDGMHFELASIIKG